MSSPEDTQVGGELSDALSAKIEEEMGKSAVQFFDKDVGDAGAGFIAEKLRGNTRVQQLWLARCRIGSAGASALAASLGEDNSTVKRFALTDNENIGDDGAEALLQMLKTNTTLEEFVPGFLRHRRSRSACAGRGAEGELHAEGNYYSFQ